MTNIHVVCGGYSVGQITQSDDVHDVHLKKKKKVFRHLKLEIALAIPASN